MVNLQNTPSGGQLTVEDLDAYRRGHVRRPHIPLGCDEQGRRPEAGHAATEVGAEDAEAPRHFSGAGLLTLAACIASAASVFWLIGWAFGMLPCPAKC